MLKNDSLILVVFLFTIKSRFEVKSLYSKLLYFITFNSLKPKPQNVRQCSRMFHSTGHAQCTTVCCVVRITGHAQCTTVCCVVRTRAAGHPSKHCQKQCSFFTHLILSYSLVIACSETSLVPYLYNIPHK